MVGIIGKYQIFTVPAVDVGVVVVQVWLWLDRWLIMLTLIMQYLFCLLITSAAYIQMHSRLILSQKQTL